jgi:hypothetical protein
MNKADFSIPAIQLRCKNIVLSMFYASESAKAWKMFWYIISQRLFFLPKYFGGGEVGGEDHTAVPKKTEKDFTAKARHVYLQIVGLTDT